MKIGQKLREKRLEQDLTLEELASRSEVTKGFLSQVERDLTSPNVAALEDILAALGTTLGEFFSEDACEQEVFTKDDYIHDDKDNASVMWIVPNAQKNMMEPIILTLHAGVTGRMMEAHKGEEFGYVLEGDVWLSHDDRSEQVKKGETFYVSGHQSHWLENRSKKDAVVLWITSPPMF